MKKLQILLIAITFIGCGGSGCNFETIATYRADRSNLTIVSGQ